MHTQYLETLKEKKRATTRPRPLPPRTNTYYRAVVHKLPSYSAVMQSPASGNERALDRYVVHLAGALAALLGRAEGSELPEDELLGRLREWGLITYPSPLLGGLLEKLPEVLAADEVLPRLGPVNLAVVGRVGVASWAAVVACGLPRAGASELPLKIPEFCLSVERLAWAKDNGCPWNARTFALATCSGRVQVLRWAREHGCDWDAWTCANAAGGLLRASSHELSGIL